MSTIVRSTSTGFQMPPLLYPTSALSPAISQATIEYHYGKHLQAYINKLNELIAGNEFEEMTLREIVEQAPDGPLANNAGQVLNHSLYFEQFTPTPPANNRPEGTLKGVITSNVNGKWTHWGELKGVDYGETPAPVPAASVLRQAYVR